MRHIGSKKLIFISLAFPVLLVAEEVKKPAEPEKVEYGQAKKLCELANKKIDESSGLACSRFAEPEKKVFWTHNDSGDSPRIYAFDTSGEDLGTFEVEGAKARDWEDMASFKLGEKAFLLLADVGDNGRKRKTCEIYIVAEPLLGKKDTLAEVEVKITFTYEDGPHNCESVAVDSEGKKIYLATKETLLTAKVYELPLPEKSPDEPLEAKAVAKIPITFATAMDISSDNTRAVILTYGNAYEFTRTGKQKWPEAFSRPPRAIPMPRRRQGESICYGPDGKTLYLTSEKVPTPLWQVPALQSE